MNYQYQFQTAAEFDRRVKQLSKKYRHLHEDLASFLQDFNAGRVHGDAIPGLQGKVYKARMRSSDMQRGKRGGFRVIYYQTEPNRVILVTIYAKVEREDIPVGEIQEILKNLDKQSGESGS